MESQNSEEPLHIQRIRKEILWVNENTSVHAEYFKEGQTEYVLYEAVETSGKSKDLPESSDVLVLVPSGYPGAQIDMPALPLDSKLLSHVVGSTNPQTIVSAKGRQWRFVSFHPYSNGGGPPWNSSEHGFHDYYNQIYTWLHRLI